MSTATEALRRFGRVVRHPRAALDEATGDGPVYAIVVLFGLNAVDELDRTAFGVLLPEIRDEFGLDLQGVLTLIALVGVAALALQVPIAWAADRWSRVRLATIGAAAWGVFSVLTGLAVGIVMLGIVRAGSSIGKATVDPTHNALISDWYEPAVRAKVFSLHRAANAVGAFVGPLVAGLLAFSLGWRVPFVLFAIPTLVFVVLALRLRDPIRGAHERRAAGADEATVRTEETAPSYAEGWRLVWSIPTLRRIWASLPFLAASLIGFVALAALLYEDAFGLDERARGFVAASVEPVQLVGLVIGARVGTRLFARDPGDVLRFLSWIAYGVSVALVVFATAPTLWIAIVANAVITGALAIIGPGILASLSMAIPPRARSMGYSVASLWIIPGLVILPIIGALGDTYGVRTGMLAMVPVFTVGGLLLARTRHSVRTDIEQVWRSTAARAEAVRLRAEGDAPVLVVRQLDVAYGQVQVLFGIDIDVREGEIVALLGTNGAGKSTLLRAMTGVVEAVGGAVVFDGRDITHAPSDEIAALGVTQIPGGAAVFPSLSVAENLRVAVWLTRRSAVEAEMLRSRALTTFPVLAGRLGDPAADLSGGQQQMLAIAMALLTKPKLVLIDELSLGLAPVVVEQLLDVVRTLRDEGTTVVIVEQSVTTALRLADRAYVMEKGEIRFSGDAAELEANPDVLRSVYLAGVTTAVQAAPGHGPGGRRAGEEASDEETENPALELREVSRRFGGIAAVDRASLAVAPGELVGIIGPNGAGKTTLFDLISGFLPVDGGRILVAGHDVTRMPPGWRARRGLGRSFQDARLFPSLTVDEALAVALDRSIDVGDPLSAALHLPTVFDSERKVRTRVDELIDQFGLGAHRNRFVGELSTGQRRVVDLAGVVAHRPSLVLLDEPSSGIAQRETEALAPLIVRIRDELSAAVVVIEHDLPLVRTVSERMIAMDQGRVVATGTPEEVFSHPVVVASYLGSTDRA